MSGEVNEEMMQLFSFVDEEDGTIDPERVAALAPVLLELITPADLQGENRDRLMLGAGVLVSLAAVIGESVSAGDEIIGELWENEYAGYLDALLLSCEQYQGDEVVFEICSDALVPLIDAATRSQMAQVKQRVPKLLVCILIFLLFLLFQSVDFRCFGTDTGRARHFKVQSARQLCTDLQTVLVSAGRPRLQDALV
jgi:hypothetical protein